MDGLFEPGLGFGFGFLFWGFGCDGTLGFVCFLTIEDGRKRNVGGGVSRTVREGCSLKETLAVTFIKRSYTGFWRLAFGSFVWKTGVKFSSIQERDLAND